MAQCSHSPAKPCNLSLSYSIILPLEFESENEMLASLFSIKLKSHVINLAFNLVSSLIQEETQMNEIRVVDAKGKLAVVRGMTALVGPITGTIDELRELADKLKGKDREEALTAIDIYKSRK